MEGTARIWFTPRQRAELWERWKNGQCVADIARALERRNKSGVYRILALNGGIAPETRRGAAGALRLGGSEENLRGGAGPGRAAGGRPIGAPGSGGCARSFVAWLATRGYDGASRRSSHCSGRR